MSNYQQPTTNYQRPIISLAHPTWRSQLRAIYAVTAKDWRQYWRYPLNAVSHILQPLVWLTPVYFMGLAFSVNGKALGFAGYTGSTDYISFILIGTVLSNFISAVFWGMGYALKNDMDSGVLESNWLAPISRPVLLVGHTITNLIVTTATSIVMLIIGAILFGFQANGNTLAAIAVTIPMLLGLYGFGFMFAAIVMVMREANTLTDVGSFLIQIFSGANFPVTVLPKWLLPVALALPLTYGFDAVRGLLLSTNTLLPIILEYIVMLIFMVVMITIGLLAFRRLERYVRQRGTLGMH
ncbi:Daunorubicin/doxorubicin resistance ABC transporter permease protein DrrB [Thermoflexales bacterium]|nr:Daunorubicin/doxorubicin resistance ABC transporter permease protein DrrB [Thermoflexales bacterium]